jgi:lipopolysaccharide transport system ATP-binding protein
VVIEGEVMTPNPLLTFGFAIYTRSGDLLWWSNQTDVAEEEWPRLTPGKHRLVCWIPPHLLNEGSFRCDLMVSIHFQKWISQPLVNAPSLHFDIRGGLSESPYWREARPGVLAPVLKFSTF